MARMAIVMPVAISALVFGSAGIANAAAIDINDTTDAVVVSLDDFEVLYFTQLGANRVEQSGLGHDGRVVQLQRDLGRPRSVDPRHPQHRPDPAGGGISDVPSYTVSTTMASMAPHRHILFRCRGGAGLLGANDRHYDNRA